jgi:hypothetical protein
VLGISRETKMVRETTKDDLIETESSVDIAADGECMRALKKLQQVVLAGLKHGHFEYAVVCEVINGGKRRLVIKAGVSHKFIIPLEEIANHT